MKGSNYYVYGLINPLNGLLFYVGITNRLEKRVVEHLDFEIKGESKIKRQIINEIKESYGDLLGVQLFAQNISLEESLKLEVETIKKYGRVDKGNGILSNRTWGGRGGLTSTSHKLGDKLSDETRLRMSIAKKGKPSKRKGRKFPGSGGKHLLGTKQSRVHLDKRIKRPKIFLYDSLTGEQICKLKSKKFISEILKKPVRANKVFKLKERKTFFSYLNKDFLKLKEDANIPV